MGKKTFAKNIKVGSVLSLYGEDWICLGPIKIYDGEFVLDRILLSSVRFSSLYTFVHPTHKLSLYQRTFSEFDDLPF